MKDRNHNSSLKQHTSCEQPGNIVRVNLCVSIPSGVSTSILTRCVQRTLIRVTVVTFNLLHPQIFCQNAGQDEEWLYETNILDTDDRQKELLRHQPPDESKLSALRETKIREKQLKNKFMKVFDYLFVLLVLVLVSYGNRDPQSFLMRNSMEQEFIHPLTVSYPQGLDDVSFTN